MSSNKYYKLVYFILISVLFVSTLYSPLNYNADTAIWPTESWQTSKLRKQGMDPKLIGDIEYHVEDNEIRVISMLIVRNGYLVEENYFGVDKTNVFHPLYSVTKSITSTVMGIAIDKGYIEGIHLKVLDFFPNRTFENTDARKQNMTIYHLLTMSAGLEWDEWSTSYDSPYNDLTVLKVQLDWVKYVLDKPMAYEPGTTFTYNTGVSHLLSAIIQQATNRTTVDFATEFLFNPLGITNFKWDPDHQGITKGGINLFLTARDMAKIGYLMLNNGTWDDQQIVSEEWVQDATTKQAPSYSYSWDYGYQWWIGRSLTSEYYYANGWAGQRIFVVQDKNLVVTFTGFDTRDYGKSILDRFIIPAALDDNDQVRIFTLIFVPISSMIVISVAAVFSFRFYKKSKMN